MTSPSPDTPPTTRWSRAPYLVFFLVGGALFLLDRPAIEAADDRIVVTAGHVEDLRQALQLRGEDAGPEAVQGEIDRFIESEVMVREARRLELDRGDMIIRRRLEQKMTFLIDDMAKVDPPTTAELEAWIAEHPERYRTPARYEVEHVYFSRERRGDRAATEAEEALDVLRGGGEMPAGDPFLHGSRLVGQTAAQIERSCGEAFAEAVTATESGWTGPVASPWGHHVLRVTGRVEGEAAVLERVRKRVLADVVEHRKRVAAGKARAILLEQYTVDVEEAP